MPRSQWPTWTPSWWAAGPGTAVLAATTAELTEALREVATGETPYPPAVGQDDRGPVWVFSGQGSQWAGMGADLLATEPVFAATIAAIEPLIAAESGFSVTEAMTAPEVVTGIDRVQPTLFAMQVALAATMKSYGVAPGAVIGHSLGESAAAVVAGALCLEDGVRVICRRSALMTRIAGAGAMASVELPAQQVLSELMARGVNDAVVAVVASPQSTVIGGATQTVRDLVAAWEQRDVLAREVAVDVASHSPQVDPILDELAEALAEISPLQPEIPYYSATSFDPREEPYCDAYYWVDNLRHTVRFAAAVQAALEDGYRVFTELTPHPLLTHAVDQTARSLDMSAAALAGMRREQPLPHGLRALAGDLYAAGAAVDFAVLYPTGRLINAPLPTWNHRRLLLDDTTRRIAHANTVAVHPLLGSHVRLPEEPERHVWQGEVGTVTQPWLADHQIHGAAALPGAAYCEMALAAARAVLGEASEVRDIRFEQMLLLDDETPIGVTATVEAPGVVPLTVETSHDGRYTRQLAAVLHVVREADDAPDQPPQKNIAELLASHPHKVDGAEVRQWLDKRGHRLGPAFAGLVDAYIAEGAGDTVLAEVNLPGPLRSQVKAYGVHPVLLDACFQSVAAHPAVQGMADGGLLLPLGVRRLRSYGSARHARYCCTTVTACGVGVEADLDVLDEHGAVVLAVRGLQLGTGASQASERARVLGERLLSIEWHERELPENSHAEPGAWLLISTCDATDLVAAQLTDALKVHDAQCTTMSWPQRADHAAQAATGGGRATHLRDDAGLGGRATHLRDDAGLLVTFDGSTYVIWGGKRSQIDPTNRAVTLSLGLDPGVTSPIQISRALFDGLPATEPLRVPACPRRAPRRRGCRALGWDRCCRPKPPAGAASSMCCCPDGVQKISSFVADLLRSANSYGAAAPRVVTPDVLVHTPQVTSLPVEYYPAGRLNFVDTAADPTTCVSWEKASTDPQARVAVYNGRGLPVPPSMDSRIVRLVRDDRAPASVVATQVLVLPGAANFVTSTSGVITAESRESLFWVSGNGVRFGIANDEATLRALGLDPGAAVQAPWPLLRTFAAGPALSRDAALLARDTVPTLGQVAIVTTTAKAGA